jgi:hypothetical protein
MVAIMAAWGIHGFGKVLQHGRSQTDSTSDGDILRT